MSQLSCFEQLNVGRDQGQGRHQEGIVGRLVKPCQRGQQAKAFGRERMLARQRKRPVD